MHPSICLQILQKYKITTFTANLIQNEQNFMVCSYHKAVVRTLLFIKYVRFANKVTISILFCQKCSSYGVCRCPHRLVYITTLRILRNLESKSPRNTTVYDIIFHIAVIELNFPDFLYFLERKSTLRQRTETPLKASKLALESNVRHTKQRINKNSF